MYPAALRAIPATVPTCGGECVLQASEHDRKSLLRRGKTLAIFSKPLLKASSKYQNHIEDHRSEGGLPPNFPKPFLSSSLESNLKSSLESSLKSSPKSSLKSGPKTSLKSSFKTNLKASLRLILEGFRCDFFVNYGLIFGVLGGS